jgi:hypothetical protein
VKPVPATPRTTPTVPRSTDGGSRDSSTGGAGPEEEVPDSPLEGPSDDDVPESPLEGASHDEAPASALEGTPAEEEVSPAALEESPAPDDVPPLTPDEDGEADEDEWLEDVSVPEPGPASGVLTGPLEADPPRLEETRADEDATKVTAASGAPEAATAPASEPSSLDGAHTPSTQPWLTGQSASELHMRTHVFPRRTWSGPHWTHPDNAPAAPTTAAATSHRRAIHVGPGTGSIPDTIPRLPGQLKARRLAVARSRLWRGGSSPRVRKPLTAGAVVPSAPWPAAPVHAYSAASCAKTSSTPCWESGGPRGCPA